MISFILSFIVLVLLVEILGDKGYYKSSGREDE